MAGKCTVRYSVHAKHIQYIYNELMIGVHGGGGDGGAGRGIQMGHRFDIYLFIYSFIPSIPNDLVRRN